MVNVGDKRPLYGEADIKKESRNDTIIDITKELKEKLQKDDISNTHITIGVYTEDYESIYGTAYSFRIHFSHKLNIYEVNSDQKTLCKPELTKNNEFRCLYMITFGDLDFIYDLMIYSRSQSQSAVTNMYGEFIEQDIYDIFNEQKLEEKIPTDSATYNTQREEMDYIFLTLSGKNKFNSLSFLIVLIKRIPLSFILSNISNLWKYSSLVTTIISGLLT